MIVRWAAYVNSLTACLFCFAILVPAHGASNVLPIIDAHSQFDENASVAQVIGYAARAGVTQVLLSARTKGRAFDENRPGYYTLLDEQFREPAFRAMSEIILVHSPKGKRAPEVNVAANTPQVKEAIQRAIAKGWPVVLHYEFRW